jgi:hypothetical protein
MATTCKNSKVGAATMEVILSKAKDLCRSCAAPTCSASGRVRKDMLAAAFLLLLVIPASPCKLAPGYFHQLSVLRGTVVGVPRSDPRYPFAFLRHHTSVDTAQLTLYQYPAFMPGHARGRKVGEVLTDSGGHFDFGPLPEGHYTLVIDGTWSADDFDIQILHQSTLASSEKIDVSPPQPNCTGGHEFLPAS